MADAQAGGPRGGRQAREQREASGQRRGDGRGLRQGHEVSFGGRRAGRPARGDDATAARRPRTGGRSRLRSRGCPASAPPPDKRAAKVRRPRVVPGPKATPPLIATRAAPRRVLVPPPVQIAAGAHQVQRDVEGRVAGRRGVLGAGRHEDPRRRGQRRLSAAEVASARSGAATVPRRSSHSSTERRRSGAGCRGRSARLAGCRERERPSRARSCGAGADVRRRVRGQPGEPPRAPHASLRVRPARPRSRSCGRRGT